MPQDPIGWLGAWLHNFLVGLGLAPDFARGLQSFLAAGALATAVLLLTFILFMGVWPAPFIDRIQESVRNLPGVS